MLLDTVKTPFFGADGQASGVVGISRDVTERKRFEQRLADSEARYRALSELLPQMVWTATADGALDYTNDWVIEYFGCGAEQLAGAGWQKYVHPEDLPAVSACWRQAVESGSVYEAELRLRHHSGRYFYHLARAVPHRDSQAQSRSGTVAAPTFPSARKPRSGWSYRPGYFRKRTKPS